VREATVSSLWVLGHGHKFLRPQGACGNWRVDVGSARVRALGSHNKTNVCSDRQLFSGHFTFGIVSFRDDIYRHVAIDSSNKASLSTFVFMIISYVGALVFLTMVARYFYARARDEIDGSDPIERKPPDENRLKRLRRRLIIQYVLTPIIGGFILTVVYRDVYVMRVQAYVARLKTIVAPYVSEQDRLMFSSRISRVTSRQEFITIIKELQEIEKQNKIEPTTMSLI